ncbi:MAG: UbiA prenyltransferase family protein [Deltaproteobacteria bacterium]|nr:UbiA prenyltransferase family protein [Deltaproteobacteria bacterium]
MIHTLWALARPPMIPLVLALPLTGLFLAHWDRALALGAADLRLVPVLVAWALLHAGSLWMNAALDRDEGEVLLGHPAQVPARAGALGQGGLALSVAVAALAGPCPAALTGVAAALGWVYSHPRTAWKGHPLGGPLVNGLGYGVLSPAVGWCVAGVGLTLRGGLILALVPLAMLGLFFAAQAFQGPEDAARGYRTLVVTGGPVSALRASRLLLGAAFAGFLGLVAVGWIPLLGAVVLPLWWVSDRHLARWSLEEGGGTGLHARVLLRQLTLTFLAVLLAIGGHYGWSLRGGGPTAGLATRAGWPADREEVRGRALARAEARR